MPTRLSKPLNPLLQHNLTNAGTLYPDPTFIVVPLILIFLISGVQVFGSTVSSFFSSFSARQK